MSPLIIFIELSGYLYPHIQEFKDQNVITCLFSSDSFEDAGPPNSQMVSEPGKNVTLTCQPKEKCLLEEVSWEKIQPQQIDVLISCNLSHGRSYTSKYPRQILSNCSHGMRKAFVTIPNVTGSDSGLYRCGFKASTGEKETFVMRLTVTDGEWVACVSKHQKWEKPAAVGWFLLSCSWLSYTKYLLTIEFGKLSVMECYSLSCWSINPRFNHNRAFRYFWICHIPKIF